MKVQKKRKLQKAIYLLALAWVVTIMVCSCTKMLALEPDALKTQIGNGSNFYIDPNGSDSNSGLSPDSAWRTLTKVNSVTFTPGDSILFKSGGTWSGTLILKSSGSSSDRITYSAYGSGAKPHITGNNTNATAVLIQDSRYITFENFEVSHPRVVRPPDLVLCGISVALTINGIYPGVIIRNNYIHDVEGKPIVDRHRQAGIFVRSNTAQGYLDNLLIEGNQLERCSSRGILMGDGTNQDTAYYNNNVVIRNNTINETALEGIIIYTAKNVLIEHNKVFNGGAYTLGVNMDIVLAGLWGRGKNMTIQYNEVAYTRITNPAVFSSMDSEAFDIDLSSPGYTIIQYNYSHDNEGGFFLHMGDPGPDFTYGIVRYNISQNDGNGFQNRTFELHDHPNGKVVPISIYNNTIYNNTKVSAMDRAGNTGVHPGIEFKNNIFYAPSFQFDDQQHILYDHNLYYSGQNAASDVHAVTVDPLLINPGSGADGVTTLDGYKLPANSPIISSGLLIGNNGGRDFFGNLVSSTGQPTIGAFQKN